MPRKNSNPSHESVVILERVWDSLLNALTLMVDAGAEDHAVLLGTQDDSTTHVALAVSDWEEPDARADKRRFAGAHDLDVVGQVHLISASLDLTVARTRQEQWSRRQHRFSPPDGHVFVYGHRVGGQVVACAYIARGGRLRPAVLTLEDRDTDLDVEPDRHGASADGHGTVSHGGGDAMSTDDDDIPF